MMVKRRNDSTHFMSSELISEATPGTARYDALHAEKPSFTGVMTSFSSPMTHSTSTPSPPAAPSVKNQDVLCGAETPQDDRTSVVPATTKVVPAKEIQKYYDERTIRLLVSKNDELQEQITALSHEICERELVRVHGAKCLFESLQRENNYLRMQQRKTQVNRVQDLVALLSLRETELEDAKAAAKALATQQVWNNLSLKSYKQKRQVAGDVVRQHRAEIARFQKILLKVQSDRDRALKLLEWTHLELKKIFGEDEGGSDGQAFSTPRKVRQINQYRRLKTLLEEHTATVAELQQDQRAIEKKGEREHHKAEEAQRNVQELKKVVALIKKEVEQKTQMVSDQQTRSAAARAKYNEADKVRSPYYRPLPPVFARLQQRTGRPQQESSSHPRLPTHPTAPSLPPSKVPSRPPINQLSPQPPVVPISRSNSSVRSQPRFVQISRSNSSVISQPQLVRTSSAVGSEQGYPEALHSIADPTPTPQRGTSLSKDDDEGTSLQTVVVADPPLPPPCCVVEEPFPDLAEFLRLAPPCTSSILLPFVLEVCLPIGGESSSIPFDPDALQAMEESIPARPSFTSFGTAAAMDHGEAVKEPSQEIPPNVVTDQVEPLLSETDAVHNQSQAEEPEDASMPFPAEDAGPITPPSFPDQNPSIPPSLWTMVVSPKSQLDRGVSITVRIDGLRHVPPNVAFTRGHMKVLGGPLTCSSSLQDPEACNMFPTFSNLLVVSNDPGHETSVHVVFEAFDLKGTRKVMGHTVVRNLRTARSEEVRLYYGASEASEDRLKHIFPLTTALLRVYGVEGDAPAKNYDTTQCQPSLEEAQLYMSSLQRAPQKPSCELLTGKKVSLLEKETSLPEEWIETSYLGKYEPTYGFHVRIDSLSGVAPLDTGLYKCIVEVSGWDGKPFVTMRHDWDAPLSLPSYPKDHFMTVAGSSLRYSSLTVIVVHVFSCENIRTHPDRWTRVGYACHQAFRPPCFPHNGSFAVPIYDGAPPRQLLTDMQSTPVAKVMAQWEARTTFPQKKRTAHSGGIAGLFQGSKQFAKVFISVCDARHRPGEDGVPLPRYPVPGDERQTEGELRTLRAILAAPGSPTVLFNNRSPTDVEEEKLALALSTLMAKENDFLSS